MTRTRNANSVALIVGALQTETTMRAYPKGRHPFIDFVSDQDRQVYVSHREARWRNGVASAIDDLETVLNRRPTEQRVHDFFERHPYLLPGLCDLHHGPYGGVVATKFPLGTSFVADFAYISSNSQTLYVTCVEIESPRKSLFRRDDQFHRDYFDARQQITDWLNWSKDNVSEAMRCWGAMFRRGCPRFYDVTFRAYLIFGRRAELTNIKRQERWSAEAGALNPMLKVMTYDRLLNRRETSIYRIDKPQLAVCSFKDRRFIAKHVVS